MTLQFSLGTTGRAATLGYTFVDSSAAAIGSRVTTGIAEFSTSGNYIASSVSIPSNAVAVYWDDSIVAAYNGWEALEDPVKVKLIDDSITADVIAASAIDAGAIASGAIHGTAIATDAIRNDAIQDNAISASKIASSAITSAKFAAGAIDAAALATDAVTEIADGILLRDWTSIGSVPPDYCVWQALRALRNAWSDVAVAGTYTIYEEDGTTVAWDRTLSTNPSAEPIVGAA